jgi:phosphatidylserine decarboxylase
MSIGHSPDVPQYTPDMRKSEDEITEAEKKEATRRIQGNFAMEQSPGDSGEEDLPKRRPSSVPTMNTLAASAM